MTTLLGISGSLRADSHNSLLIRNAAEHFGADTFIEGDINLPLYNGDDEAATGIPASVQKLADQIAAADAIVISTPEYNQSISGALKNALDWVSRVDGNPWAHKPVAIMSAAAGRAGGSRGLSALRLCMQPFRTQLLQAPEVMVAASYEQFDDQGSLKTESYIGLLKEQMKDLKALT